MKFVIYLIFLMGLSACGFIAPSPPSVKGEYRPVNRVKTNYILLSPAISASSPLSKGEK